MSNTKRIMEQAQAFASAWSLVGGAFDGGDGKERAEEEKAELQRMVEELETALNAIPSSDNTIDGLSQYVEKLESHLAALENQKPVFWYRPHSDGQGYDGPIHDSQIEPVRRESGAWNPLFSSPVPRVRIEWLIEGKSGHGEWFPSHSRTTLADYCKVMDDSYGTGSHRVVDEPYSPVTAPVRLTDEQLADAACNANSSFRAIETAVLRANGFSVDQPDCAGAGRAKQRQDKFVQALRYIAWESGSYAEAVQCAKKAIEETGAIPTPPCAGHAHQQEIDHPEHALELVGLRGCNSTKKFNLGDLVRKKSGAEFEGRVVGEYSTGLTPEGYAVESIAHKYTVQIYPAAALELIQPSEAGG